MFNVASHVFLTIISIISPQDMRWEWKNLGDVGFRTQLKVRHIVLSFQLPLRLWSWNAFRGSKCIFTHVQRDTYLVAVDNISGASDLIYYYRKILLVCNDMFCSWIEPWSCTDAYTFFPTSCCRLVIGKFILQTWKPRFSRFCVILIFIF